MFIQPVDDFLAAWFLLALASTAYVAWDQFRNNSEPVVMKWGFILVTLYWGRSGFCCAWWPTRSRDQVSTSSSSVRLTARRRLAHYGWLPLPPGGLTPPLRSARPSGVNWPGGSTGENLGHHLQVADSERLKSRTHIVSRTAFDRTPVSSRLSCRGADENLVPLRCRSA